MTVPPPHARTPPVRLQDRVVDVAAALLLGGGTVLFAVGRRALSAIADGSYPAPAEGSWVMRADQHAAQVQWGTWLVLAGVMVAVLSALRHAVHRRRAGRQDAAPSR